jgi:hypothetical protein
MPDLLVRMNSKVGLRRTNVKMKLKFDTISSRTYSGKNLKASGAFDGSGSL